MIDPISLEVVGAADLLWQLPCAHAFLPEGLRRRFGDTVWAKCPCCRWLFCWGNTRLLSKAEVAEAQVAEEGAEVLREAEVSEG